ncbi:phage minor head protein [Snodgrassella sp. CFCC 13594]|uniref:phage minor head protein n=1 Tax=Snodgrassella sp. CFCC 13594 TaxID=1775559 RepID=UPI00083323FE|nr:phage minor head protein [Snodgrassella sp. CFCC 13594]
MPKLSFALDLPPTKAIDWLKAKGVTTQSYRELTASELAKVVTVSRITDLDMLQSIKDAMVKSAAEGTPFSTFKKELLNHMQTAGWLHPDGNGGKEIIDPKSGEVYGAPRRLETLYRTNMQSAFSAGQYQTYMGNIDNRPYWQYNAVGDSRTRPSHLAMSGLVYRYDDPFWATFYPPNGYNCRCSVTALAERDVTRRGLIVGESTESNFIETNKIYNKRGDTYPTKAYKAPDGTVVTTDRGFDYNAGRMNYRPDLDRYDHTLAQVFAKADMTGPEFKAGLKQLQNEFEQVKNRLGVDGKPTSFERISIRNTLSRQLKFAAGVLSHENQKAMGVGRATAWLSDDTLIKQVDSRTGQNFDAAVYGLLPDVIAEPDYIFKSGSVFSLLKKADKHMLLAVIKYVGKADEIYVQSYRYAGKDELKRLLEKQETVKATG